MTGQDVINIADYAIKANNPLITIPALFFIVFVGYCLAKKFFATEYITDAQHKLNSELQQEIERLNKKVEQLTKENDDLKKRLKNARS